jgi:hypothetical protein
MPLPKLTTSNVFASKPFIFLKNHGWDVINLALIYFFLLYLIQNSNLITALHGDLFQYLTDGRMYFLRALPSLMQIPPLHPIFIQILSRFWFFTSFPEFKAAVFLNTISTIGSLVIIYSIARKLIGGFATLLLLLVLMVHPHTLLGAVDATPEPLLLFFVLISIFLWTQTRYKNMGLVMAGMSALVKIEGVILVAIFAIEIVWTEIGRLLIRREHLLTKLHKQSFLILVKKLSLVLKKHWGIWVSVAVVFLWLIVATINNHQNAIPYGNRYLEELANRSNFFDFSYFFNTPFILFFPINTAPYQINFFSWPVLTTLLGLVWVTLGQRKNFIFYSSIFTWGYLMIHGFFPAHENRYYFPIIFLLIFGLFVSLMKLFSNKIIGKLLLLIISSLILCFYLKNEDVASNTAYLRNYRAGYIYAASWFKFQQPLLEKNIIVVATEPIFIYAQMENGGYYDPHHDELNWEHPYPILNYFGTRYMFLPLGQVYDLGCSSFTCVVEKFQGEFESLYVIYNHENFLYPDIYPNNQRYFNLTKNPFDQDCLKTVAAYEKDWTQIMKYDLEECQGLLLQSTP